MKRIAVKQKTVRYAGAIRLLFVVAVLTLFGCSATGIVDTASEIANTKILGLLSEVGSPPFVHTGPANCRQDTDFALAVENAVEITVATTDFNPVLISTASPGQNCLFKVAGSSVPPNNYSITVTPTGGADIDLDLGYLNVTPASFTERVINADAGLSDVSETITTAFLPDTTDYFYFWVYIYNNSTCATDSCNFIVNGTINPAYVIETRKTVSVDNADTQIAIFRQDASLITGCLDDRTSGIGGDGVDFNSGIDAGYSRIVCPKALLPASTDVYIRVGVDVPVGASTFEPGAYTISVLDTSLHVGLPFICPMSSSLVDTFDSDGDGIDNFDDGGTSDDVMAVAYTLNVGCPALPGDEINRTIEAGDYDWFKFVY